MSISGATLLSGAAGGPLGLAAAATSLIGINLSGGSPRYEGGPLVSSVEQRLNLLREGDATAIAQTHSDAVSGGAGWKETATVLAPAVRPDLFGQPARPLTDQEKAIVGNQPAAVGGTTVAPNAASPAQTFGTKIAELFGFGPTQQQNLAQTAGSAAGAQVSSGITHAAIIIGVVILAVVLFRHFARR